MDRKDSEAVVGMLLESMEWRVGFVIWYSRPEDALHERAMEAQETKPGAAEVDAAIRPIEPLAFQRHPGIARFRLTSRR